MVESGSGTAGASAGYVLGHADAELRRLTSQARVKDPMTRRFLTLAGVCPGMRVLDVGSGAGDVALLLADLVGPVGVVVGFDRSAAALEVARAKAAARGVDNVSFVAGGVEDLPPGEPFDAVVGRYVLQFQERPAELLAAVAARARPDAVVLFHELDWSGVGCVPPVPTYERVRGWAMAALERSGATAHMGLRLPATFRAAGYPIRSCVSTGASPAGYSPGLLEGFVLLARTLAPAMAEYGIASAAELELDTLGTRIADEAAATGSVLTTHLEVGAWARVPG